MARQKDPADKGSKITLDDVAKLAEASPITVSRALRNPGLVAEATRQRILRVIEETGYIPDMAASTLASNHSRIVAVVIPLATNPSNAEVFQGLADRLEGEGLTLLLGTSRSEASKEEALVQAVIGWRPAALALTGLEHSTLTRKLLSRADFPVIELSDTAGTPIDMAVGFSNAEAMRALTDHVWAKGYRSVHYIHIDHPQNARFQRRREGFLTAMKERGVESAVVHTAADVTFAAGAEAGRQILAAGYRPNAVLCTNDIIAVGAMFEFIRAGVAVPEDIAIAGFENIALGSAVSPSLTSVHIDWYGIGRLSGENIVLRLAGKEPPRILDTGFEIVDRESTPIRGKEANSGHR